MVRNKDVAFAALVLCLAMNAAAQNTLTLSIDSAKATIRSTIYGALLENWGRDIYGGLYVGKNSAIPNTNGMRNDIIEGMKECGIAVLEFPGGCFADQYHWRDGVGPVDGRPGGDSKNGMGTDEYMQLCELIGAEPNICANLKTGTPAEMAEWINYVNNNPAHPEWHVKYWSLGNEPWGCGGELNAGQFSDQYGRFASAVPAIPNKPIVRIAGAGHWSTDWVHAVMGGNPGKLEGFSVHKYLVLDWTQKAGPSFNYTNTQYYQIIQMAYEVPSFVRSFDKAMDKYDPDKKIGLMYNEWGAWYAEISAQGYTFSQSTVRDALIAAIHLNTFNNFCERVHLACVAQPVNVIQSLFLTDKADQTRMVKTPVFYCFKLFKVHQNATKIPIDLKTTSFNKDVEGKRFSFPYLTASASLDSAGRVNITISNSDLFNSRNLNVLLNGATDYASVTGKLITAPEVTALNDFGVAEKVNIQAFPNDNFSLKGKSLSVKVPSKSVILLTLAPEKKVKTIPVSGQFNHRVFSIRTARGGRVIIDFTAAPMAPVKLTLFGIDGSVAAETSAIVQGSGNKQLVWQPPGTNMRGGIYKLHVETEYGSFSKKVAFTR